MRVSLALLGLVGGLALETRAVRAQSPVLERALDEHVPALDWTSEVYRLRSKVLGEELRLHVGKPPSFARSQLKYPLLCLLDGQYYFAEVQSVVAALCASGQIPEMLLIGIESRDRRVDFTPAEIELPNVGARARAAAYLDFLEHEFVPAAESSLRAGKPRVLLGHSHAGMLVLHAVTRRPAVFPWVIAVDAPTHHEHAFLARDLRRALGESARPPVRIVSLRVVFGWSDEQWALLQRNARPDDLLSQAEMSGETHESMLFAASYRGLQALFADASALGTSQLSPLELDALYRTLAARYGAEVAPPETLMRRVVEDFLMEGRGRHAAEWLERTVATYGKPQDFDELAARVKEVTALGEPTETVASLLALPRATPDEMKDHLGTWLGTTWRDAAPRVNLTVRFWVEDGIVQGRIEHDEGPSVPIEYARFRPDGALEFGFKNGMRPRGLIMYEDKDAGGPLEGEILFRGMRFVPPPGEVVPAAHFELRRATQEK